MRSITGSYLDRWLFLGNHDNCAQKWDDIRAFMRSDIYREATKKDRWYTHWESWVGGCYPILVALTFLAFATGAIGLVGHSPLVYVGAAAFTIVLGRAIGRYCFHRPLQLAMLELFIRPYTDAFERFLRERLAAQKWVLEP